MPHENFPNDDAAAWRAVQYVVAPRARASGMKPKGPPALAGTPPPPPARARARARAPHAAARAALWRELARARLVSGARGDALALAAAADARRPRGST